MDTRLRDIGPTIENAWRQFWSTVGDLTIGDVFYAFGLIMLGLIALWGVVSVVGKARRGELENPFKAPAGLRDRNRNPWRGPQP